jgi:CelD/BcsL family acetyltransferase involved in cellulose biosynthesis
MITIVDDRAGFDRLREHWNPLLQESAADSIFLTWEWLSTWWKHQSGGRRLFILVVHSGGAPIAIAPFALSSRPAASPLSFPTMEFLGTGTVGSDYLDVIIRRGAEEEALNELGACLARKRMVLDLAQVSRDAFSAHAVAAELKQGRWRQSRLTTEVCPFIRLAGHSWDSYLASLGRDHRYNFRRRLKNASKQFDLRFEPARSEGERRDALARLLALHDMRWQGRGGSDAFQTPAVRRFHDEITQLALDRGWLRLFILSLDGEPAAALYGFCYRQVFSFYQSGIDPKYHKHSVGLLAMGLAIKRAIEEGAEEYDLLHGNEAYKFHWAKEVRELERLELYPPSARAIVLRQARAVSRATKKGARRMLPKTVVDRIDAVRRLGMWKRLYGAGAH